VGRRNQPCTPTARPTDHTSLKLSHCGTIQIIIIFSLPEQSLQAEDIEVINMTTATFIQW